ncbi:MAG TPA: hypothetical protein PK280_13760 [Planctomycetota bacterium]|nr:hypothetical protein [Planctomycetota bacterium]
MELTFPDWQREKWADLPGNPVIAPLEGTGPGSAIGDPQVLLPGEFDRQWHLFCHRYHFYHFVSNDGLSWRLAHDYPDWKIGPVSLTADRGKWIVYCTQCPAEGKDIYISARTSEDLVHWSEPVKVLEPVLDWEREGRPVEVRNPSAALLPDGRWRLYYCGGTVWLDDCGYEEPKHIGCAEASGPLGPFVKRPAPLLSPDPAHWYRNFGTGGVKVYGYGSGYLALINGMYHDEQGRSRSAIDVLLSADGLTWRDAPYNPIILPSGDGWKSAIVYQLDLRWYQGRLWLFYNARDGWKGGREWIGCSTLEWSGPEPRKLWRLS